jgi:putative protease
MEGIAEGVQIFRNYDKRFYDTISTTRTKRTLPITLTLSGGLSGVRLTATDECGTTATARLEQTFDVASKPEVALGSVRSSLGKSGGSVFDVECVNIDFEGDVPFIPTGAINALRRDVLERLEGVLMEQQPIKKIATEEVGLPYLLRHIKGDHNVVNSLARKFYEEHGVERIDEGYDALPDLEGVEVMRTPYCIRRECGQCLKKGSKWSEPLYIVHGSERYRLRFDCKECMMYVVKS